MCKSGHSVVEKSVAKPIDGEPKELASRHGSRLISSVVTVSTEEVAEEVLCDETRSSK